MPKFDGNPLLFREFHRNAQSYLELIGLDDAVNGNLVLEGGSAEDKQSAAQQNKALYNFINLNQETKKLFYMITRERYIGECLEDFSKGKQVSGSQLQRRRQELCKHHHIPDISLSTLQDTLSRSTCFRCEISLTGATLVQHFKLRHPLSYDHTLASVEAYDKYRSDLEVHYFQDFNKRLREHRMDFVCLDEPAYAKYHVFRCSHCDYVFR